jgi:hypothetical protein
LEKVENKKATLNSESIYENIGSAAADERQINSA